MPINKWVNVFDHAFRFGTVGVIQDPMVHSKPMGCKEAKCYNANRVCNQFVIAHLRPVTLQHMTKMKNDKCVTRDPVAGLRGGRAKKCKIRNDTVACRLL